MRDKSSAGTMKMTKKGKTGSNKHDKLSKKKKLFIEYLSDPEDNISPKLFAEKHGLTEEILYKWKSDPYIVRSAFQLCVTRLGAEIPKVLKMLLSKSLENKDVSACKLFFQQLDKITEIPETGVSVDEALEIVNKVIFDADKRGKNKGKGNDSC
ncbi:MAG: hypothetical protein GY863_14755 [bacterium]|nr:hypothetical protein [bacterium]